MIDHISIEDFAIISRTEIDFEDGLNVITGETGAGKSIVVEAMNLALGGRADSSFVRRGKERARIQLAATINGEEMTVSREISSAGKNLCRISGELTTRAKVAELSRTIADIHGQYENQKLLDPAAHLALVDSFRSGEIGPVKTRFSEAFRQYGAARRKLEALVRDEKESRRRADYLNSAVEEINRAALSPGEEEELNSRVSLLQNSEKIFEAVSEAETLLSDPDTGAETQIGEAASSLHRAENDAKQLQSAAQTLETIRLDLGEISAELRSILDQTQFEPGEIDQLMARLDLIERLKARYGDSIREILSFRDKSEEELSLLEHFEERKAERNREAKEALAALKEASRELTRARKKSAAELGAAVEKELQDLNFDQAALSVEIRPAGAISSNGEDACEILISTNRGEPLKPLAKTASGGEISRIMLAIKNVTGRDDNVPTMIFDEIDEGISGVTASVVARKLRQIAKDHQIICITHLPQIAAAADANYRIYKDSDEDATYTHVEKLYGSDKTREIARLLSGDAVTETTMRSAEELIGKMR